MMLAADFSVHALLHPNQINGERNYTNQDDQGVYHLLVPQACKLITNTYQMLCWESSVLQQYENHKKNDKVTLVQIIKTN